MTSVRASKSKGSQFEMDCAYSLRRLYPELVRHGKEGFQKQVDLESSNHVFECKRLKGMSWNQAVKYFEKLNKVAPKNKEPYLLFKSNQQPCLVMSWSSLGPSNRFMLISTFEDCFGVPFLKHPSTRIKK